MPRPLRLYLTSKDRSIQQSFTADGDVVVIGRSRQRSECDIVVDRKDVSRVHVRLLRGCVVEDLGSTNGTYVDGKRITGAVLVTNGSFQIGDPAGDGFLTVRIEAEEEDGFGADATIAGDRPQAAAVSSQRVIELVGEVASLRSQLEAARAPGQGSAALQEAQATIRQQEQRIRSLKEQLEREGDNSPAAPLQSDEIRALRQRSEQLQQDLEVANQRFVSLQAQLEPGARKASSLEARVAPLERDLEQARRREAELVEQIRSQAEQRLTLERQLEQAFAERATSERAKAQSPAAGLMERQAKEIRELKEELARLRSGDAPAAAAPRPAVAEDLAAVTKLKADLERMRGELLQTKAKLAAAQALAASPPPPAPSPAAAGRSDLFRRLLVEDATIEVPGLVLPAEDFLLSEQYVCFRSFEKVVTRVAAGFQQIFNQNTVLPGTAGANFRALAEEVLRDPENEDTRRALASYTKDLARWLAAAVQAHQRASLRFFDELKRDLSEDGLTRQKPVKGIGWAVRAELWERAQAYLARQSSALLEERLEQLAREEANAIVAPRSSSGADGSSR